jgi:predicted phosphate transport protein (TIGR00153 family)
MGNFFQDYFLNGAQFYNLFDQAAENAVEMAGLLVKAVNTAQAEDREVIFKHIDRLENVGDDITHKIYLALDKVIFTPLNRPDIHTLASAIDDVADFIHEASERMYLYNITDFLPAMMEIANIILNASSEIKRSVNMLRLSTKGALILESCRQIKHFEHQSDQIYYNALADLFANEKNAITLIKYREILYSLETTTNKCKSVTDVLRAILVNSFNYSANA